jgi:quercetin dioxygenase-like cupin family protein
MPNRQYGALLIGAVVSGRLSVDAGETPAKELPSGSFFEIGKDVRHTIRCLAGEQCLFWTEQPRLVSDSASVVTRGYAFLIAASEIEWTEVPEMPGTQEAIFSGYRDRGTHYTAMNRWTAGIGMRSHVRKGYIVGGVISGVVSISVDGSTEKTLGPGSFFWIPGGSKRGLRCGDRESCVFVAFQPVATDIEW